MRSDTTQMDLGIRLKPTAEDWRQAAATALINPYETPDRCRQRADYCLAQAKKIEESES
ncbi:hypothetical protein NB688_000548 [Xanthomonas sacchari]|uniref:HEPN domain-containing protein n=1 Tax=Xanthomonas sacchari TaxID=56458 RepID=A0ABT3DUR5_9XANT|nr:hypothetical protein [Xanthomonas sacchari]MCW0398734.1 hypothetical protein [Xanthomonas sacchari]MCW0418382.1 hypothetical protein [Xanthomonas sacchari]UYK72557.1 hypothetical protein NG828_20610 [Xanthomonas sacchari]